MIVTITVKCRPDSQTDETFNESFKDFRAMIEDTVRRGGFGQQVHVRWLLEPAITGREVPVV